MNKNKYDVSIIIPVMNEEENIEILAGEITDVMRENKWKWECVWVDDYSTDSTRDKLKKLNKEQPEHKYVFHAKNYGQSAAMSTGFRYAEAEIIVTMDGDGQNSPESIPGLVSALIEKKADIINGKRQKRHDNIIRKICSKIANAFRNIITGESVSDVGCSLRAFRKECVKNIPVFKGMHRFFPTLVKIEGYNKIYEIPVIHRSRERGQTKYGINNRLWVGIADTLAVCWMRKRMVRPETSALSSSTENKK
jgi:dolichol-phosphate mannosyltransferase